MSDYQIERILLERQSLTEISQILRAETHLPDLLGKTVSILVEAIEPAETGIVFLWDDSAGLLTPYASTGYEQEVLKVVALESGESHPGKVFSSGKAHLFASPAEIENDLENLQSNNLDLWQQALGRKYQPKNILAAPITSQDRVLGVLSVEVLDEPSGFTEADLEFIQLTADLLAMRLGEHFSGILEPARQFGHPIRADWTETLAHELRMPLTAIKGYASALLIDEVEWSLEKRQEFLQLIEDECDQMEALLSDFLSTNFIDRDRLYLEPESLQMSQIAHKIAEEMERRTDNHQLIVDFPSNLPQVQADPRWIKQVIRNLLDNAIKYSPGGGLIVIRGKARPSDIVISVSDQGMGMPPEDLILIFDKNERARSFDGTLIPGTGIGLPLARSIVEAHGGRIWVDSTINQGSTLSFSLPYEGLQGQKIGDGNEPGTNSDR